jgi:TP901-1 family phage major tail protein
MNGADVLLLVNLGSVGSPNWTAVGSQRDVSFSEQTASIDVSSKDSRAQRVIAGRYSSTVSLDALYVPDDASMLALKTANRNGDLIQIMAEEEGENFEYASGLITSMDKEAPDQGEVTISIEVTIDGEWTAAGGS